MKEDIIAANLSSLRSDIQALPDKIAEKLPAPSPALPPSQLDGEELADDLYRRLSRFCLEQTDELKSKHNLLVEKYDRLHQAYNDLVGICNENSSRFSKNILILAKRIDGVKQLLQPQASCKQPSFPPSPKEVPRFLFTTYLPYWLRRIWRNDSFRKFTAICFILSFIVTLFTLLFIAHDNATMRKECEKNRLIRHELRKSKESEAIINYIDMLYSDKEVHGMRFGRCGRNERLCACPYQEDKCISTLKIPTMFPKD